MDLDIDVGGEGRLCPAEAVMVDGHVDLAMHANRRSNKHRHVLLTRFSM